MDNPLPPLLVAAALLVLWRLVPHVFPSPFPPARTPSAPLERAPLPDGLPVPVERFYRGIYPDGVPVITSAILSGRATLRVGPVTLTARFRFTHAAGRAYEHRIEAGLFGARLLKVHERYERGRARLALPGRVVENEPKVDQGANLALWAESMWLPAIFLTDHRVRWEPLDAESAVLMVPFEDAEQRFLVRFHAETGLPQLMESMRYKDARSPEKTLWLNGFRAWRPFGGWLLPSVGALTWLDDGRPWAVFRVEEVAYNADVSLA